MNPSYPSSRDRQVPDRPEATLSVGTAAAAMSTAPGFVPDARSYFKEPSYAMPSRSQYEYQLLGLDRSFQQPPPPSSLPYYHNPSLAHAANPLIMSAILPPPSEFLPHLAPENRRRSQAVEMLHLQLQQQQQQQQAFPPLSAPQNLGIMAVLDHLADRQNQAPFSNSPNFNSFPASLSMLPSTRLVEVDTDRDGPQVERNAEKSQKREAEKMEEEALYFLGSTTHEAKNGLYFDASVLTDPDPTSSSQRTRGGVTEPFPEKVHRMITDAEANGNEDIISFMPHGRAFMIHDQERFVTELLGQYLRQSLLSSFHRQLNLYGFIRINSGTDEGAYYHELFLRGRPSLCAYMRRVGVPTILPTGEVISRRDLKRSKKRVSNMAPDFYSMKPITAKKAEGEEEAKATDKAAAERSSDEEKLSSSAKDCESKASKASDNATKGKS